MADMAETAPRPRWHSVIRDLHAYVGIVSAALGFGWWIHPGAGLVVFGFGLLSLLGLGTRGIL